MKIPTEMPRLKGLCSPREIIFYAVWAYYRFALSTADVEDLPAERGVTVSRETVRKWVNRFGSHFATCLKRNRPAANDKWHLNEVVIPINGRKFWLWRAVDADGDVLDILVQPQRNGFLSPTLVICCAIRGLWSAQLKRYIFRQEVFSDIKQGPLVLQGDNQHREGGFNLHHYS